MALARPSNQQLFQRLTIDWGGQDRGFGPSPLKSGRPRARTLDMIPRPRSRWRIALLLLAGALYVLLPTDLVPDIIPVFGWLDDMGVLASVLTLITREIRRPINVAREVRPDAFSAMRTGA
jgi:hypothetical protein